MASSPPNRRKTSPLTSIPVDAPTTPRQASAPLRDELRTTPGRASYLSPTKASLARHNPHLLQRPQGVGRDTLGTGGQAVEQPLEPSYDQEAGQSKQQQDIEKGGYSADVEVGTW